MEGRRIYVKHPSYLKNELNHSGIKGMHWGERLYQYEDGSLTPLGRIRYGVGQARVRRAEQAAAKAKVKAEQETEREKRKYQNKDGTLKLRGKLHYKTTDKYALLSDDEIRQQTNRLQLKKNLEDMKRQTSSVERLKSKIGNTLEDVTVSGIRRMGEKLVNNFVDKSVSKILGTDKENVERARKFAETVKDMSTKEMNSRKTRAEAENKLYKELYGTDLPKEYNRTDLTEKDKAGVKRAEEADQNNTNQPSKSSEKKKGKQLILPKIARECVSTINSLNKIKNRLKFFKEGSKENKVKEEININNIHNLNLHQLYKLFFINNNKNKNLFKMFKKKENISKDNQSRHRNLRIIIGSDSNRNYKEANN